MKREHWKSQLGFMWAAVGSAVGLGSIWRFPYMVGQNGGAAFVLLFCVFLLCLSLPIMLCEIVIGRKSQSNPSDGFKKLGKGSFWKGLGTMQVVTGFLVSIFYSVICGQTLGYVFEALTGNLTHFTTIQEAKIFFQALSQNGTWIIGCQIGFIFLASFILFVGVQKGIEATNKILMPTLFFFLLCLALVSLSLPNATEGLKFLFTPDFSKINGSVALLALGQAFFGLSVGQGTMITYGSYLRKKDNLFKISIPVTFAIILVSMLSGIAIFCALFSYGGQPADGTSLVFETLPLVFSSMTFGGLFAAVFFLLLFFAGLTSQISAMEPFIAYLIDHKEFSRKGAVLFCGFGVLLLSIPVGLSFGPMANYTVFGATLFEALVFLTLNILVPLGALAAVLLLGWKNPLKVFFHDLQQGVTMNIEKNVFASSILTFVIRYLAPLVIFVILLNSIYAS